MLIDPVFTQAHHLPKVENRNLLISVVFRDRKSLLYIVIASNLS